MVNETKWAAVLIGIVAILFSRRFEAQLAMFDVAIHCSGILLLMTLLVYPPDESMRGIGLHLSCLADSLIEPPATLTIQYYCWKIILHMTYFRFAPAVIFGYFLHGHLCYVGETSRFPEYLNYPTITFLFFSLSVAYAIWYYYANRDYTKWKFYKFFAENPNVLEEVQKQMFSFETVRLDLKRQNEASVFFTENYFIYVSNRNIAISKIGDIKFLVNQSITPPIHVGDENDSVQSLVLLVSFDQEYLKPVSFTIRENVFREVQAATRIPVTIAEHIELQPTEMEMLLAEFAEIVSGNSKFNFTQREREPCFACGSLENHVKLSNTCENDKQRLVFTVEGEGLLHEPCTNCSCPPYWCLSCMGKIFITKQKTLNIGDWLNGSANCPTCRRLFCINDVHLVEYMD